MAEATVQLQIMSSLSNYIQAIFRQVMQNIEAYHLNVKGDITSMGTVLSQHVWRTCAKIAKYLNALQRDVTLSGKGSSFQQMSGGKLVSDSYTAINHFGVPFFELCGIFPLFFALSLPFLSSFWWSVVRCVRVVLLCGLVTCIQSRARYTSTDLHSRRASRYDRHFAPMSYFRHRRLAPVGHLLLWGSCRGIQWWCLFFVIDSFILSLHTAGHYRCKVQVYRVVCSFLDYGYGMTPRRNDMIGCKSLWSYFRTWFHGQFVCCR